MVEVKKISENVYEVALVGEMKVPVRIYASEKLLRAIKKDRALEQMMNVASLPGVLKNVVVLPDAHQGYGFSIGGVAGFDDKKGIISPGGVGYDINCSVRMMGTNLFKEDVVGKEDEISKQLFRDVPTGVGKGGLVKVSKKEMEDVLKKGAKWAVEKGYGVVGDLKHVEEEGCMAGAGFVSEKAISRGINQLGSLGAGNHFLELQFVEKVYDKKIAKVFGLEEGQVTIMIHCGSRGLGHQVASDYIKQMEEAGFGILVDRGLVNAPVNSELGKKYYSAMCAAANFSFCNKQVLAHQVRETMKNFFLNFEARTIYEVCHNIAKFEEHVVDGKKKKVCVHRKGATRSFGAGRKEVPLDYRKVGQPVIIPGSMATASYILAGTKKAEELTFGSTAHGAGRVMSRNEAMRVLNADKIKKDLKQKNISLVAGSKSALVEESSESYKDIDEVVRVSDAVGIGKLVAKLKPLIVVKG